MAIRNHWKKILLALFATMWAGCENGAASNPMPAYGCGPCGCDGNGCEIMPDYGVVFDPNDPLIVDSTIVEQTELYGPPCVFNGTCDDESVSNENPGQE
ncbi:MAG: hypothetical protein MJZ05_13205 [Fibrobacter sp.]|nr:hypothetical protein [Fibrobacter sp.]